MESAIEEKSWDRLEGQRLSELMGDEWSVTRIMSDVLKDKEDVLKL